MIYMLKQGPKESGRNDRGMDRRPKLVWRKVSLCKLEVGQLSDVRGLKILKNYNDQGGAYGNDNDLG